MQRLLAMTATLALFLAAGCAADKPSEPSSDSILPGVGSGPRISTDLPLPAVTTTPMDECTDASGDGGPMDLKSVVVYADDDEVTGFIELWTPVPTTGTAMLGLFVSSADGKKVRQLGIKWVDGKAPGPFVADLRTGLQDNLGPDELIQKAPEVILVNFPTAVADLGKGWKWSAFTNAAGNDTDACPGPTGAMQYQPFAARVEKLHLN